MWRSRYPCSRSTTKSSRTCSTSRAAPLMANLRARRRASKLENTRPKDSTVCLMPFNQRIQSIDCSYAQPKASNRFWSRTTRRSRRRSTKERPIGVSPPLTWTRHLLERTQLLLSIWHRSQNLVRAKRSPKLPPSTWSTWLEGMSLLLRHSLSISIWSTFIDHHLKWIEFDFFQLHWNFETRLKIITKSNQCLIHFGN